MKGCTVDEFRRIIEHGVDEKRSDLTGNKLADDEEFFSIKE